MIAKWRERRQREDEARQLTERQELMKTVSLRLLLVTILILAAIVALFALPLFGLGRFPVSWFCFGVGVIGGFVSIQQRLKKLSDEDLVHLESSWVHIVIPPFFGGIFALILYVVVLSAFLEGSLFPKFVVPDFGSPPTGDDLRRFLLETYPASGQDFARLTVWSFLAGFSERLVPNILKRWEGADPGDKGEDSNESQESE